MSITDDRSDPGIDKPKGPGQQNESYLVLSDAERAKGFVRPVRRTYVHDKCGVATTMGTVIAETYARDPAFYGATWCCGSQCRGHFLVGEFKWNDGTVLGS